MHATHARHDQSGTKKTDRATIRKIVLSTTAFYKSRIAPSIYVEFDSLGCARKGLAATGNSLGIRRNESRAQTRQTLTCQDMAHHITRPCVHGLQAHRVPGHDLLLAKVTSLIRLWDNSAVDVVASEPYRRPPTCEVELLPPISPCPSGGARGAD